MIQIMEISYLHAQTVLRYIPITKVHILTVTIVETTHYLAISFLKKLRASFQKLKIIYSKLTIRSRGFFQKYFFQMKQSPIKY